MLTIEQFTQEITIALLLGFISFCTAMLLTPLYTQFAYKNKLWKRSRTHSTTGEELKVIARLRIKRSVPLMAGLVTIASIVFVTVLLNFERSQTWLPLVAVPGGYPQLPRTKLHSPQSVGACPSTSRYKH